MNIKVTPDTLSQAREAVRNFLNAYEATPSAHLTPRALRCLEKAMKSEECESFRHYIECLGMEEGILAKVFGLEFEF